MNIPFIKPKKHNAAFYSFVPELEKLCPVTPAEYEKPPAWVMRAHAKFKEETDSPEKLTRRYLTVSRCPGIRSLMQRGFVVKSWHDFTITTNGDQESMQWNTPDRMLEQIVGAPPIVLHEKGNLADFYGDAWPATRHKTIVKCHMPWRFTLPKGYVFLMLPVPYADDPRFESASGVLDPEFSNELNIQLYWNVLEGTEFIRKGTPLCYLVPIPRKDTMGIEYRKPTPEERGAGYLRNIATRFLDIPHEINRALRGEEY
jgi:hypothetical protein